MNHWVRTKEEVKKASEKWNSVDRIALDTEFIRETTFFPEIALIQVATETDVWLVDPTVLHGEDLDPFFDLLENPKILKIMHAAFADQECFYWAYECPANAVFDTAVAAALVGRGDNIGLGRLVKDVLGVLLPKGHARAKWLERPLPQQLEVYAIEDVKHLVKLSREMEKELRSLGRFDWAMEECEFQVETVDVPAESIAERLGKSATIEERDYGVLVELVKWREGRAKSANLPRNWVADNETLMAMSKVKPHSIDRLSSFRGLKKREIERNGAQIISAIERGQNSSVEFPKRDRWIRAPEGPVVSFIQTYVGLLSEEKRIAPRFLLTGNRVAKLVSMASQPVEKWVEEGVLSSRAAEMVGGELKSLLEGRRGLILENGRLKASDV